MRKLTKKITCQMCGKEILNTGGARKYCSHCRVLRDKELRGKR